MKKRDPIDKWNWYQPSNNEFIRWPIEEVERLRAQCDSMVAPEELRQWKEEAERLRKRCEEAREIFAEFSLSTIEELRRRCPICEVLREPHHEYCSIGKWLEDEP